MDNENPGSGPGARKSWEQHLNDAGARLEEEVRRVVKYVDEEVVPEVRRNGSKALRIAADRLQRIAEQMEERPPSAENPPETPPR